MAIETQAAGATENSVPELDGFETPTLAELKAQHAEVEQQAMRLLTLRFDLRERVDHILHEVAGGNPTRAAEIGPLKIRLAAANREGTAAEEHMRSLAQTIANHEHDQQQTELRQQFVNALTEAIAARTEFIRLFRLTSITLGTFCLAIEKASSLCGEMGGHQHDRFFLQEAEKLEDPFTDWDGVEAHLGFGYDLWKRLHVQAMKTKIRRAVDMEHEQQHIGNQHGEDKFQEQKRLAEAALQRAKARNAYGQPLESPTEPIPPTTTQDGGE